MKLNRTEFLLILIVIIGAVLRVRSLWNQLPDWDENWTLHMVGMPWGEIVRYSLFEDFNPPLFYLAAKFFAAIGRLSIIMVRMPSLIAGILLIPVAYLIGEEAEDEVLGLGLAGFIAILYPVVYYSQYARSFAMAGLFTAIAIYAFLRVLKYEGGHWLFVGAGLAALYTHAFTVVPFLLMGGYLWVRGKLEWKHLAGTAMVALPYAAMMFTIAQNRHANYGLTPDWVATYIPFESFGWIAPLVVIFIIIALFRNRNQVTTIFTVIPVLTAIFAIVVSPWTPIFPRYTLAAMPMLAAVAMTPVTRWIRKRSPWLITLGTLVVVLNLCQIVALWYFQLHPAGAP